MVVIVMVLVIVRVMVMVLVMVMVIVMMVMIVFCFVDADTDADANFIQLSLFLVEASTAPCQHRRRVWRALTAAVARRSSAGSGCRGCCRLRARVRRGVVCAAGVAGDEGRIARVDLQRIR